MEVQRSSKVGVGLSFASMAMLYSVMLIGVYISSSNEGLSCREWPLCPNGFGLPSEKYFFEYYHRVLVVVTAGLIYGTTAYALRKASPARKTALVASIAVSVQIVFGFLIVSTRLEPLLVAAHLSTGILLFAMSLMTFLSSYGQARKPQESTTL